MTVCFVIGLIAAMAAFGGAAFGVLRLRPENAAAAGRFCRNRALGAVLTAAALALCVPQAEPIAWNWLATLLWPLVAVFTVLCWRYLDMLTARAIAGLLIIGAYYFVNFAFFLHVSSAVSTAAALGFGVIGIVVSAKPYLMRDWLEKCASSRRAGRWSVLLMAAGFAVCGVTLAMLLRVAK
ncbi:MAG: hypothetical protein PHI85_04605 [Victivallaceae bacterium]|nr:hypothetical protein [Victivallaceae bacterium]